MGDEADSLFGFERVTPAAKTARVRGVFDSVSERYDVMNDLMSVGMHRLWKRYALELLDVRSGQSILDLACGTADLSRLIARRLKQNAHVVCSDLNASMLSLGRDRMLDHGLVEGINYVQANAEKLPLADSTFDRIIMGFGLRNVTDKPAALREMERILRPGGRALILEFSQVRHPALASLYDQYSFKILPRIGAIVAGDADSYRYLAESIRVHPDQESLKVMMQRAGLENVRYHNLVAGVVAVHIGFKY
jgi:demethylmenaquinone methyltransferase / 2-methoxy-6-polyprenyl-1,4-benzoquinol methylase